ncbi:hypothetical protein ACFTZB_40405 [Rhodococcus sp. NPDC057014]|uniref:hypothetical protein n=1 Tax=Rhodococcus sp. NPDC057014 TaxID=3346000 RepID=UPI003632AE09
MLDVSPRIRHVAVLICTVLPVLAATGCGSALSAEKQAELSFFGLVRPGGVAVSNAGDVFVVDEGNNRVLKLTAGATSQEELPFVGLESPEGIAVNDSGDLFVVDTNNDRVLKLSAGATQQVELSFKGVSEPHSVAVSDAGSVYVSDFGNHRLVGIPAGGTRALIAPKAPVGSNYLGIAVDPTTNHVVAAGGAVDPIRDISDTAMTIPALGETFSSYVAIDDRGTLFASDLPGRKVLMLPKGATEPTELTDLKIDEIKGIAVNDAGTELYATDGKANKVVKVPVPGGSENAAGSSTSAATSTTTTSLAQVGATVTSISAVPTSTAPVATSTIPPMRTPLTTFGNGAWAVGTDIAAGVYKTPGAPASADFPFCIYSIYPYKGASVDELLDGKTFQGQQYLRLTAGQVVETQGCKWTLDG